MNWTVEERFSAQYDPSNSYRIMPNNNKWMLLHMKVTPHGTATTSPIAEFETISEAVAKAEEHSQELAVQELPAIEERVYTSEQLIERG